MSTRVEIWSVFAEPEAEPRAEVIARLSLDDEGAVAIEADSPELADFLRRYGAVVDGPPTGELRVLDCADGADWLRALPYNLRGTYLWAATAAS